MAGLLDEVMDGIAAKEGQTPTTPTQAQTPTATTDEKKLHNYSDQFNNAYGDRKK